MSSIFQLSCLERFWSPFEIPAEVPYLNIIQAYSRAKRPQGAFSNSTYDLEREREREKNSWIDQLKRTRNIIVHLLWFCLASWKKIGSIWISAAYMLVSRLLSNYRVVLRILWSSCQEIGATTMPRHRCSDALNCDFLRQSIAVNPPLWPVRCCWLAWKDGQKHGRWGLVGWLRLVLRSLRLPLASPRKWRHIMQW